MTKNPILNALSATGYIVGVASLLFYGKNLFGPKDTLAIPIAMLSLFTLSAAAMGFFFFYQPVLLFLDGHKKKAVDLFLQTLAVFAGVTILIFLLVFFRVFP